MQDIDEDIFLTLKKRMKEKFPILLSGYLRDAQRYMVIIETNLDNGSVDEIIESAHSLKSASGLLGLQNMDVAAEKIEYAAKSMKDNNAINFATLRFDYIHLQESFSTIQDELIQRSNRN